MFFFAVGKGLNAIIVCFLIRTALYGTVLVGVDNGFSHHSTQFGGTGDRCCMQCFEDFRIFHRDNELSSFNHHGMEALQRTHRVEGKKVSIAYWMIDQL